MDASVQHLASNIRSSCRVRQWDAADLAAEMNRHGSPISAERAGQLMAGDQEPLITEAGAVAAAFGTTLDALMTDPDDYERALAWTSVRNLYTETRRRLMQAAADYERAAETLCDYMDGDPQIPPLERDELEHQFAQSCAWVAMDGYQERNPWRGRWGIPVDADDPVSHL